MNKLAILALLVLVPSISFAASFDTNLRYGSHGAGVLELQEFLTAQGVYSGPISGNFFSLTLAGVKAFQVQQNVVPVSGFFGPLTRAKALAQLDASLAESDAEASTTPVIITPNVIGAVQQPVQSPAPQTQSNPYPYWYGNTQTPQQPVVQSPPMDQSGVFVSNVSAQYPDAAKAVGPVLKIVIKDSAGNIIVDPTKTFTMTIDGTEIMAGTGGSNQPIYDIELNQTGGKIYPVAAMATSTIVIGYQGSNYIFELDKI